MSEYPALFEVTARRLHSLHGKKQFLVGRKEDADVCLLDPNCSREHFRIYLYVNPPTHPEMWVLEPLSQSSPTYCNGHPMTSRVQLRHGVIIQAGQSIFRFLERPESGLAPPPENEIPPSQVPTVPPQQPVVSPMQPTDDRERTVFAMEPSGDVDILTGGFKIKGTVFIGREKGRVEIPLVHPHVSRVHAQLILQGNRATISDLRSANGTFVNGKRIEQPTPLRRGDRLDIGPYSLIFTGDELIPKSRENNVELICRNLKRQVFDRKIGQQRNLLDNISLVIRPHEVVCLLGPTGAGKSLLLSAMSARVPASEGQVFLNGKSLYANFDALKQDLVVVPQRDALYESLTVEQALWYAARLRLPPDTSKEEMKSHIDNLLQQVDMTIHSHKQIRNLSGGQLKRTSLACELVSRPTLLFLDEVTSGLDEQTDREIMQLFRTLADAGKTVVCVTHTLANVEQTCHLVAILTVGGKLAFFGSPVEALRYFGIERLGDVYSKLKEHPPEHWQQAYASSPLYARYITSRMPAEELSEDEPLIQPGQTILSRVSTFFRQARLLTQRYLNILVADWRTLLMVFGQSLLVAVLLVLLFGDLSRAGRKNPEIDPAVKTRMLLFLMCISSFWFGCNNSAKEIVKDRIIYLRERDFNLMIGSYYLSKLLPLTIIGWLQTALLWGIVAQFSHPPLAGPPFVSHLLALSAAGTTLGLAISAFARSEDMAVTMIPLALIPQIILSDIIAPLKGVAVYLGKAVITCYWGCLGVCNLPAKAVIDLWGDDVKKFDPTTALLIVLAHALVYMLIAYCILFVQDLRLIRQSRVMLAWVRMARARFSLKRTVPATDGSRR